jgi:predicted metalloprotease with PDZ domain
MKTKLCTALLLTFSLSGPLGAETAGVAMSRCREGHPETGDIGILSLLCVSGSCQVNLWTGSGYRHEFSTEPRVDGVLRGGPADGRLQDGDVIIAIDGALITTREGGRRLASLKPGVPVTLRIRRGGKEMDVTLVPRLGCNMPRLAVLGGSGPAARPAVAPFSTREAWAVEAARQVRMARTAAPFSFGLELECGPCGWRSDPWGALFWTSPVPPTVRAVVPGGPGDLAGLEPGDVLLAIDGHSLSGAASGRALGKLPPGEPVELRFRRGRETRTVSITPEAAPRNQRF